MKTTVLLLCLLALSLDSFSGVTKAAVMRDAPVASSTSGYETDPETDNAATAVVNREQTTSAGYPEEGDSSSGERGSTSRGRDAFFPDWPRNEDRTSMGYYNRPQDRFSGGRNSPHWFRTWPHRNEDRRSMETNNGPQNRMPEERDSYFPNWSRIWTHSNGDRTYMGTYNNPEDRTTGFRGYHDWNDGRSFAGGYFERDHQNNGTGIGFRLSHRWRRAARAQSQGNGPLSNGHSDRRTRRSPQNQFDLDGTLDRDRYGTRGTLRGRYSDPYGYLSGRYSYGTDGHTFGGEIGRSWNDGATTFRGYGDYNTERGGSFGFGLSHRFRRSAKAQSQGNGLLSNGHFDRRTRRSPQNRFDLDGTLDRDRYGTRGTLRGRYSDPYGYLSGRYSYGTDGHTFGGEIGRSWNDGATTFRGYGDYNTERGGSIGFGLSHRFRRSAKEQTNTDMQHEQNHLRGFMAQRPKRVADAVLSQNQYSPFQGTPYYEYDNPEFYYNGQDRLAE